MAGLKPGPKPVHANNAEKQKAYRARQKAALNPISDAIEILAAALVEAGCARLARGLDPMTPGESILAFAKAIEGKKLIVTQPETPEQRKARADRARLKAKAVKALDASKS